MYGLSKKKSWLAHGKDASKKASGRPREGWGLHSFNTGHLGQVSKLPLSRLARSLGNQALVPFPMSCLTLEGFLAQRKGLESQTHP